MRPVLESGILLQVAGNANGNARIAWGVICKVVQVLEALRCDRRVARDVDRGSCGKRGHFFQNMHIAMLWTNLSESSGWLDEINVVADLFWYRVMKGPNLCYFRSHQGLVGFEGGVEHVLRFGDGRDEVDPVSIIDDVFGGNVGIREPLKNTRGSFGARFDKIFELLSFQMFPVARMTWSRNSEKRLLEEVVVGLRSMSSGIRSAENRCRETDRVHSNAEVQFLVWGGGVKLLPALWYMTQVFHLISLDMQSRPGINASRSQEAGDESDPHGRFLYLSS